MHKVKDDAYGFHAHADRQEQGEGVALLEQRVGLHRDEDAVESEECQVDLHHVVELEGELVLKRVDVFHVGIAVDDPDVEVE